MEEDYQKALEVIFTYSYECCAFKHNIYGDLLEAPDGMPDSFIPLPPEFFVNPKCSLVSTAIKDMATEPHLSEAIQEPEENTPAGD